MNRDWRFSDVAATFDAYVHGQLPWYDVATWAVATIARQYVPHGGLVYDLGAATGNVGRALEGTLAARGARLIAVERDPAMASVYKGPGDVVCADLADVDPEPYSLAVSFLTFMFTDPADVGVQVRRWAASGKPGSALVVVERTTPAAGYPSLVLSRMTLDAKRNAGVTPAEIIDKELALSGIQRPIPPSVFTDLGGVEFFRFADFGGYIIEGPGRRDR